ncbi:MAG: thioredoxin family protein [candidate division Zixibacteria bacterium CG_4_9_14_3_um_filter_46_8]|nr:MAG: thioredoxin family protein [candidate division Zixibacteria bacterium CG_4_9_14_3_um_filter_46_8]
MITVTILGTGCTKCRLLEGNLRKAAQLCGVEIQLIKSRNSGDYIKYKVKMPPALIVNKEMIGSGRVPSIEELVELFSRYPR